MAWIWRWAMGYRYCVLGAGRQGTAAAYDLGRFGNAEVITLADVGPSQARSAASRLNELLSSAVAEAVEVNVSEEDALLSVLEDVDVVVSAVPYRFNLSVAEAAVRAGASMVDLGGNTDIVREELALDSQARDAGVALVPDCGMGPGMNVSLLVYAMEMLDEPRDAYVFDGGLPQDPQPPWNYALTFHIEGLINEYTGAATFLREGKRMEVPALSEPEEVDIPPLGKLEARVTSGGLSTTPWTFEGKLQTLENKTLRYPGHWDRLEAFRDLGLFGNEPINVDGEEVVPRRVFGALYEPQVSKESVRDVAVIRVVVAGTRGGEPTEVTLDLVARYDEATGFTAMERVTGGHAAIIAQMIAAGDVRLGAHSVEVAVDARQVMREARSRGFQVSTTSRPGGRG